MLLRLFSVFPNHGDYKEQVPKIGKKFNHANHSYSENQNNLLNWVKCIFCLYEREIITPIKAILFHSKYVE